MIRQRMVRFTVSVFYTLAVTLMAGKWAVRYAFLERGYDAAGGEYCLILFLCWLAWRVINYLFDALEEFIYGRNSKKTRGGGTSWMQNNG